MAGFLRGRKPRNTENTVLRFPVQFPGQRDSLWVAVISATPTPGSAGAGASEAAVPGRALACHSRSRGWEATSPRQIGSARSQRKRWSTAGIFLLCSHRGLSSERFPLVLGAACWVKKDGSSISRRFLPKAPSPSFSQTVLGLVWFCFDTWLL